MRALSRGQLQPGPRDFRRNPLICTMVAIALSAVFWTGLFWVAARLMRLYG